MKPLHKTIFVIMLPLFIYSQVAWNLPPEYHYYSFQNRTVQIILPPHQNFTARTLSANQVILEWGEYWTETFRIQYTDMFGYEPIPNRFSIYKQNLTDSTDMMALTGVPFGDTSYIDIEVENGKQYVYQILASDNNFQTIGGLQKWSQKDSAQSYIKVGVLGIEEETYWEEVEEYEKDRKGGWFGCSTN